MNKNDSLICYKESEPYNKGFEKREMSINMKYKYRRYACKDDKIAGQSKCLMLHIPPGRRTNVSITKRAINERM